MSSVSMEPFGDSCIQTKQNQIKLRKNKIKLLSRYCNLAMQPESWDLSLTHIHFEKCESVEQNGTEGSSPILTGLGKRLPQGDSASRPTTRTECQQESYRWSQLKCLSALNAVFDQVCFQTFDIWRYLTFQNFSLPARSVRAHLMDLGLLRPKVKRGRKTTLPHNFIQ